jgi:hypothetical protein
VAARNEQYAIQDWSNNRKTKWQGSLNRNRNLVLVGEVPQSADNSIFQYMEWLYDRPMAIAEHFARAAMPSFSFP